METVKVQDGSLAVTTHGSGAPVLLIHGAMVADSYGPMLAGSELRSSHRLISYHRRGFQGSSPVQQGHTIADEAADAIAVLDHFGVSAAHVVGHSYAGAVALQMALDTPARVHSLGLFEPGLLSVPAAEAFGAGAGAAGAKFQAGDHPGALLEFLTLVGGENPMARLTALPAEASEQALADLATLFLGDLPALGGWTLSDDDARSITQPALTMFGTESVVFFKQCMAKLEGLLPNTEPFSLTGASHFLQMEKPAQAAAGLGGFLSRHPIKH